MKTGILKFFSIFLLFSIVVLSITQCTKTEDAIQNDIYDKVESTAINDKIMNPGPDPEFTNYEEPNIYYRALPLTISNVWERFMYVDKTDTLYNSTQGKNVFTGYLRKYGFTGVYLYSTSGIVSSTSNYTTFSNFLKQLNDSGVIYRGVANGSATTFQSAGNITKFNNSQSDPTRRINIANLELEWWNNACTWSTWNTTNQQINSGTIPVNDFYEGWYQNLGTTIDTIAARDQVKFSDRILLHCYQNGIPTYSYANAQSTGATGGRLDIIAKGARQANKRIDLYIIISAENTAWGASNTFTGPALANAYVTGQSNPYLYIEQQAYNNIIPRMTALQNQWINFKGFVWFTKRYCYAAVPR